MRLGDFFNLLRKNSYPFTKTNNKINKQRLIPIPCFKGTCIVKLSFIRPTSKSFTLNLSFRIM